jgi:hypothetical protein
MGTADHDPDAFAEQLAALKRRGCAILVVNPPSGTERCEALLGEDGQGRERVVVDTEAGPSGASEGREVIHAEQPGIRSVSAAARPDGDLGVRDLDAIAEKLHERIDELAGAGLEPGELRVCFGDAETLAAYDEDGIESFFEDAAARVRAADGMGHAHVPVTSPVRDWIEPTFDVTVEVRATPGGRQQRWLLHDDDLDSGWLAIEDGT